MSDAVPHLDCPECGVPLIPADARGFVNDDGEYVEHSSVCRCPHCDWRWTEDDPVTCACGAVACVDVDDEYAFAKLVPPAISAE